MFGFLFGAACLLGLTATFARNHHEGHHCSGRHGFRGFRSRRGRFILNRLLDRLDTICETFLAEYEQHALVSRQRVALWQALDLLSLVLTCWTKVKPVRLGNTLAMIERHLHGMGLNNAARAGIQ